MNMTLQEAWNDFVYSLHTSGRWDTLERSERQYIDKANRQIKRGAMPVRKVRGLFDRYAPGVYQFKEAIFTKLVNPVP